MTLGITGGVASGKSTVKTLFAGLGAATIDADDIARRLTAPGKPLAIEILLRLGRHYSLPGIPDAIDRAKLAKAVFHHPSLRQELEMLTHPPILEEMANAMRISQKDHPEKLIVVEVPLLFEARLEGMFDHIAVVWCSPETQIARLRHRLPNLDSVALVERIASQISLDDKRAKSEFTIDSNLPLDRMEADVAALYRRLSGQGV